MRMALRSIHESVVETPREWESKEDHIQLEEIGQDLHSISTHVYLFLAEETQENAFDNVRNTEDHDGAVQAVPREDQGQRCVLVQNVRESSEGEGYDGKWEANIHALSADYQDNAPDGLQTSLRR